MIKVGDFVKGISDKYGVTNRRMTKAVVTKVEGDKIAVKVLEHENPEYEMEYYSELDTNCFHVIGHQKKFDRKAVLELLKAGCTKAVLEYDLSGADLRGADLRRADLSGANLRRADLDYSCFPLRCGGLKVHIDDKQAIQLLYHLASNVLYSKNTSDEMKQIFSTSEIISTANRFHRVDECGKLEPMEMKEKE